MPHADDAPHSAAALALPKVLLHEHLDGGLRVATLFELLRHAGITAPAAGVPALAAWFDANAHAGSLTKYLEGFALTVAAMAHPDAMNRVAFEAAEDAMADGAVLAEFRIAPLLFEAHGVPGDVAVEALLAGLARSALPSGLIVCAMRHLPPDETVRAVELALRFQGRGVVGFDLAGPEHGFPPAMHAWAEVFLPGAGWRGLDPTRGIFCDDAFVPVAHAALAETVNPVQGGFYATNSVTSHLHNVITLEKL